MQTSTAASRSSSPSLREAPRSRGHLTAHRARKVAEGGKHTKWRSADGTRATAVPRHREIGPRLVRASVPPLAIRSRPWASLAGLGMEPGWTRWCNRSVRTSASLALCSFVLLLFGCSGAQSDERRSATSTLEVGADDGEPAGSSTASATCRVTIPTRSVKGEDIGAAAFNFGTADLRVHLNWPRGRLRAGVLPGGGTIATINADGSITAKVGWWRGIPGKLVISGRRLDGEAPPLRADVPEGYGSQGFQPTGLTFPTTGCWEVTGKVGDAELTFVVTVSKVTM
jgi:hypothetical protein